MADKEPLEPMNLGGMMVQPVAIGEATAEDLNGTVAYTIGDAEGALPKGTRILKVASYTTDGTTLGDRGTVISSFPVTADDGGPMTDPISDKLIYFGYFVEWDHTPGIPVLITDFKIAELNE